MALRLKYAEIPMDRVQVDPRIGAAVEQAARAAAAGSSVVICPTYTAMLDIRADLQRRGAVAPFWEN